MDICADEFILLSLPQTDTYSHVYKKNKHMCITSLCVDVKTGRGVCLKEEVSEKKGAVCEMFFV